MLVITRREKECVEVIVDGEMVARVYLIEVRSSKQARLGFEGDERRVKFNRENSKNPPVQMMNKTWEKRK